MFIFATWLEALLLVFVIWLIYVIVLRRWGLIFDKLGITYANPGFPYGNLQSDGLFQSVHSLYCKLSHKKVFGFFFGPFPIYVVSDLDIVRQVLVKEFNHFTNRTPQLSVRASESMKLNMLALKDDHWKRVRGMVSPTFTSGKLKALSKRIEIIAEATVKFLGEKQERNEEVELKQLISRLTMDLISSVGFGAEVDSLHNPSHPFAEHAKMTMKTGDLRNLLFTMTFLPLFTPVWVLMSARGIEEGVAFFDKFVDAAIKDRREENAKGPMDFLQLMVEAEKKAEEEDGSDGLSMGEIKGQALVFLLAGYETVSTVLSFVLFMMAVHPECCKKVQEEIDEKIGSHAVPNYDNVQSLEYLNMCISETLRMYPPGYLLDRQVREDIEIDGFKFLKGRSVMVPVYSIHHDPQYWSEPKKFIPERFTAENKAARHPFAYLPFGHGPRNCVGLRLAQLEMNIIIGSILQHLTPVRCDKTVYPVTLEGLHIRAKDGAWVKFERR